MAWDLPGTGEVDDESPLNETLFTKLRDCLLALFDGSTIQPADCIEQANIADDAVGQDQLKTAPSEDTDNGSGVSVVVSTFHKFDHLIKHAGSSTGGIYAQDTSIYSKGDTPAPSTPGTSYHHNYYLMGSVNYIGYFYYLYVNSSPPYALDGHEEDWWSFLWLLRDKTSGVIRNAHFSDDPPWSPSRGHLPHYLPKNDPERMMSIPHPWWFDFPDPALLDAQNLEVVLVDTRELNETEMFPTEKQLQYEMLKARRQKRLDKGLTLKQCVIAEEEAKPTAEEETFVRMSGLKAARMRAKNQNRGILELIHDDAKAELSSELKIVKAREATREIAKAQRDRLPDMPVGPDSKRPWREVVRVLQLT